MNQTKYPSGARVLDSESEKELIVLNHKPVPIRDGVVYEKPPGDNNVTVLDKNPERDPNEDTVEVVYVETLNNVLENWNADGILLNYTENSEHEELPGELNLPITIYSFPVSRLKPQ